MTTAASGDSSNNNNSSNNTSPASFNLAGEIAPLTTAVPSSSLLLPSTRDRCGRCQQLVYVTERIGPVKDSLYHKLCF